MSSLSLNLLGPFEAFSNGETITELRSSKAQALLIYLAVEKGTAHRRESLFTLLWPGMPEKSARHNLRQVLYSLRQIFPEVAAVDGDETVPLLLSGRQTIQINPQAAGTVDVHQVNQLLDETQVHDHLALERCARCIKALNDAVDLYQGEFLSNFYLEDSNEFEDWATATREAYQRKVLEALQTLSDIATSNENFEQAKEYAERQLEIDPLKESAHRQLMENLARTASVPQPCSNTAIAREF